MSLGLPVAEIVDKLRAAGYTDLGPTVMIAGIPFKFAAILVGTTQATDLVVVADTVTEPARRLRQRVDALATAMDVAQSRRSLTVITVGPPPDPVVAESIARVARVLVVRPDTAPNVASLSDVLAVLLPLDLPSAGDELAEPLAEVEEWMSRQPSKEDLASIISAARDGTEAVSGALAGYLAVPIRDFDRS